MKTYRNSNVSFGLVYPNRLKVMLSSYTVRFLYNYLNFNLDVFCDRFCLPEKFVFPAQKDVNSSNALRSLEFNILPNQFDILGFSIHYENDYRNILWFLEKAGIPLSNEERSRNRQKNEDHFPFLISGGPVITSNPLPFENIFDAFFIGDSEKNLPQFLNEYNHFKKGDYNFIDLLNSMKKINGIYLPSIKNETNREILQNLDDSPIPTHQISKKIEKGRFENNFFVEINRGCPFKCKFCISSFHNHPFRNRSSQNIIETINKGLIDSEFEKISLIGSCTSSHPEFSKICSYIIDKGKSLSVPSIRLEHITPELIKIFEKAGIKTITIAPEAGSNFLRNELGKKFQNEDILNRSLAIRNSKIRNIKFYFLIGLPGESEKDVYEIVNIIKLISELDFPTNSLRININPFIPKFNTPYEFQTTYFIRENLDTLKSRLNVLLNDLRSIKSVRLKVQKPKELVNQARLQALISLGDGEIAKLLLEYYRLGANLGSLRRAEKTLDISTDEYFKKINSGYKPWNY